MPTYTTTPKWLLRKLTGSSLVSDIDAGFAALADDIDPKLTPYDTGLLSARPTSTVGTPGKANRRYYATDVGIEYIDTGTSWIVATAVPRTFVSTNASGPWATSTSLLAFTLDVPCQVVITAVASIQRTSGSGRAYVDLMLNSGLAAAGTGYAPVAATPIFAAPILYVTNLNAGAHSLSLRNGGGSTSSVDDTASLIVTAYPK